ncbi:hypothetical protein M404DRAFT_994180 [Pisolithus tinctorius Marx 270]|uniref:Uncharacterized protein n=1 Tax=Pisolithus tinctorius Marx 270 TaxID=870435 RepID=A0A0C3KRQ4_PISTI|nr:hypothetical protein M404DRAFT_994180 [Pisolithus tinctorius Marx 270]
MITANCNGFLNCFVTAKTPRRLSAYGKRERLCFQCQWLYKRFRKSVALLLTFSDGVFSIVELESDGFYAFGVLQLDICPQVFREVSLQESVADSLKSHRIVSEARPF